jgi:hypothetical protein
VGRNFEGQILASKTGLTFSSHFWIRWMSSCSRCRWVSFENPEVIISITLPGRWTRFWSLGDNLLTWYPVQTMSYLWNVLWQISSLVVFSQVLDQLADHDLFLWHQTLFYQRKKNLLRYTNLFAYTKTCIYLPPNLMVMLKFLQINRYHWHKLNPTKITNLKSKTSAKQ